MRCLLRVGEGRKRSVNSSVSSRSRFVLTLLVVVGLALTTACTVSPEPDTNAADEVAAARAEAEREVSRQEMEAREREADRERRRRKPEPVRETLVVVSKGGAASTPTVAELARATREERQRHGDRSVGELTDENLAELSAQGKVTFSHDQSGAAPSPEGESANDGDASSGSALDATTGDAVEEDCGESCWRRRALELRQAWSEAAGEIETLEEEAADLRWAFYAEDDPWVRDSQIKPAWDRTLDRLRQKREEANRYGQRVDELMDQGRRAGALPGWLRAGMELEPEREPGDLERTDPSYSEPVEPNVVEEDPRQPSDPG